MKTKIISLVTSDRLKLAVALLAVAFLILDAIESKSIGAMGWLMFCIYWSLPESKPKEEKKA